MEHEDQRRNGFRQFGQRMFLRATYADCMLYLEAEFGDDWQSMPRKQSDGKWTKLGWRLEGIRNLLWHVDQTNFFEYKGGSKTYYFRFPIFYRKMVRDGCRIHYEKPGPTNSASQLQQTQPHFSDPTVRSALRKKVFKVCRRRYLMGTTLADLESIIRYFGVPKGEDDVRVVYDATASGFNDSV